LLSVRLEPAVTGTKDWTKCEYEFDVPTEAYAISIGATMDGSEEMYAGGLKFETTESNVTPTVSFRQFESFAV